MEMIEQVGVTVKSHWTACDRAAWVGCREKQALKRACVNALLRERGVVRTKSEVSQICASRALVSE